MRTLAALLILTISLSATGCATLFAGEKMEPVAVTSQTPGAQIVVDGIPVGQTPTSIMLNKNSQHAIQVLGPAGEFTCVTSSSIGVGWILLDVFLTGLIGLVVDAITGAWSSIDQGACYAPI